jgi:hypothetical protein
LLNDGAVAGVSRAPDHGTAQKAAGGAGGGIVFKTSLSKLRPAVPFGATVQASGVAFLSLTLPHVEELAAAPSRPVRPDARSLGARREAHADQR